MEEKIENQVSINDILIKGLADEVIKSVKDYLKKNCVKEEEIRINIEMIENKDPYKIEILTTIYRRNQWKYLKKVSGKT